MAYVIYQKGYVVFGFGKTFKSALSDAREWTDIENVPVEDYEGNHGDLVWTEISPERLTQLQGADDPANFFDWEND